MIAKCLITVTSFGYINTSKDGTILEKDKNYELEKAYDEVMQVNYYMVLDNGKLVTTLSESETQTFFGINK